MCSIISSPPIIDDPRLGNLIQTISFDQVVATIEKYQSQNKNRPPAVVIIGFGYDIGCQRNGGRVGAAHGPDAVRKQLPRMGSLINPEWSANLTNLCLIDAGDVPTNTTLEEAHNMLEQRVAIIVKAGGIPFVLGGSNDQSYPNACGMIEGVTQSKQHDKQPVFGVVNIDAHLDVRPRKEGLVHSGSPFRELLEDSRFKDSGKFVEFAAQGNQCSQIHVDYVISSGHDIIWLSTIQNHTDRAMLQFHRVLDTLGDHVFVSFDIDSIQSSDCPGVSCPATIGLTGRDALEMSYIAGCHARVRIFDVSEFNPHIEDYRTARLVVNMLYWFLLGLSTRNQATTKTNTNTNTNTTTTTATTTAMTST